MALLRPTVWTQQPQQSVEIDWSNPVTLGLKAVFDQRYKREHITGTVASVDTATSAVGRFGRLKNYSGSANTRYPHHPNFAIIGDITIVALCEIRSLTNYTAIVAKQGTVSSAAPYELRLGGSSANRGEVDFIRAGASGFQEMRCAVDVVPTGFSGVLAFTRPTGTITDTTGNVFVNGNKSALSAAFGSGNGAATDNGTSDVWIGRRYDGVTQLDGKIYYVLLFNRVLNDFEIRSISQNPWQIFKPMPRRIFAEAGAGGGVTITTNLGTASASGYQASISASSPVTINSALGTATASGLSATLAQAFNLSANRGTATASGAQATIAQAATISANLGTATASGFAADVQSAGNVTISANIGIATASGRQANIGDSVTVSASRGTATAAGYTAAIEIAFTLAANRGTAQATGKTATIYASDVISASMGQAIASGYAAFIAAGEIYARAPSGSGPLLITQNQSRPVQTHATRYSNTGGIRR